MKRLSLQPVYSTGRGVKRVGTPRRRRSVTVAVPASMVTDVPHPREKTAKIGLVGRALAIFRAEKIIVYRDLKGDQSRDSRLIEVILNYMATPQYLRKRLFKLTPELNYVGVLPPLRTPNHPLAKHSSKLRIGEVREGVVIGTQGGRSLVDIGVEKPAAVTGSLPTNTRLNFKILSLGDQLEATPIPHEEIDMYWGYTATATKATLGELVRRGNYDLRIATSRYGRPLEEVAEALRAEWLKAKNILVAFGSPSMGLREILLQEDLKVENLFQHTVNIVRHQGAETVRTEEAVLAGLALLNFLCEE